MRELETYSSEGVMKSVLKQSLDCDPPHLLNVCVKNAQDVPLWYTVEPDPQGPDGLLVVWEINRRLLFQFEWGTIVDVRINSQNYELADRDEWDRRQLETNLKNNPDMQVRQSMGIFWKGGF